MRLPARSVALLLPLLLTACFHKTPPPHVQTLPPPLEGTPKPTPTPVELPPSAATIPPQLLSTATVQPPDKPKSTVRHRKAAPKPSTPAGGDTQQSAGNTQQGATETTGVSAIGQLSSGDPSDLRKETTDSLAAIERGLNGIGHTLNSQEEKTAAQIREYLKQAREALTSGDVDGAHTLVAKAKVLLGELSQ